MGEKTVQEKRFSELTEYELRQEIAQLQEKAQKAEQMGMVNEYAVIQRKIYMAKAYLLDPNDFKPNEIYEIHGDPETYFQIEYLNGVVAWGYRLGKSSEIEALPISMLIPLQKAY